MWGVNTQLCNSSNKLITKDDIYDEIERCVSEGNSLESTKTLLESKLGRKLGSYDIYRIEERFVDFLTTDLLEKVPQEIIKSIDINNIIEFINKLHTINSLDECCDFFSEFSYFNNEKKQLNALKTIWQTSSLVKDNGRNYLNQFKQACFTLVHTKADYVNGELCFNKCLTDLLKYSKNPDNLCQSLGLLPGIINDIKNDSCFKEFLNKLLNTNVCQQEYKLQQAIKLIVGQDKFVLNKDIKNTIESYLKKTVLEEKQVDGRLVLEVQGRHIVISKVLEKIETKLRLSDHIEEVRFCNPDVVHIDEDLSDPVWHGKNIVLYADTVVVSEDETIIWDVSGKNATETSQVPEIDTNNETLDYGLPGADGKNGESGGNVLVMVDVLKNAHNLKIISVGGFGSNGQDGKVGAKGENGKNIDKASFKKLFPPVSKLLDSDKIKNLEITKKSVLDCFQSVEKFFYDEVFLDDPMTKYTFEMYLSQCINKKLDFYFELITDSGCKITFSFYYGPTKYACQSYLLRKGPSGEEGKPGGAGGQGGSGGIAGEVEIRINQKLPFDLSVTRANGACGTPGKMGQPGMPGKNGVDRAYLDYSRQFPINWPKYRTPDVQDEVCLSIDYSRTETKDNVWSPHNDSYASIGSKRNEYKIHDISAIRHEESMHLKPEAYVPCKKAISKESIRAQYEEEASCTDLGKLNSILEHIKTVIMECLDKDTMETEQITTEVKVVRSINYSIDQTQHSNSETAVICLENLEESQCKVRTNLSSHELVKLIKSNPTILRHWLQLFQVRLNLFQLQDLWNTLNNLSLDEDLNEKVKKIGFCNKYQLAILGQLTESFDNIDKIPSNSVYSLKSLASTLQSHLIIKNNTNHEPLGEIQTLFLKDSSNSREEVLKMFKGDLNSIQNNRQALHDLLMSFLDENSNHPLVMKKLQDVSTFEEDSSEILKIKFVAFKSALMRSKNNQLNKYLVKSILEGSNQTKVTFQNEIIKDRYLNSLYKFYIKALKTQFSWESLFTGEGDEDNILLEYMFNTFKEKGPFCALYREFLAYHYKTNIMIYSINERNETILMHKHNSTGKLSLHFLIRDDAFVQLSMDKATTDLLVSHLNQGAFYNSILSHVDSFVEKEQFDEFTSRKPYLSECYKGPEKSSRIHVTLTHIVMEDDNIKVILKSFMEDKEIDLICSRLEKLKLEYTGCESILHYLALHFESEGAHISAKELCLVLNFALKCALKKKEVLPLITWIIAAYPQTQWIGEIILLKVEFNYNQILDPSLRLKFKNYLHDQSNRYVLMLLMVNIGEKDTKVNIEKLDKLLYLLSNIPQAHVGLDQLDLDDWMYYLQNKFWTHQLKPLTDWSEGQLKSASYHLVSLESIVDTDMCKDLIELLRTHKSELITKSTKNSIMDILRIFADKEMSLNKEVLELLKTTDLCSWKDVIVKTYSSNQDRSLNDLIDSMKRNSRMTDDNILDKLTTITKDIEISDEIKGKFDITDNKLYEEEISRIQQNVHNRFKKSTDVNRIGLFDQIKQYIKLPLTDETFESLGMFLINLYSNRDTKPPQLLPKCNSDNPTIEFSMVFAVVLKAVEMKLGWKIRASQKLAVMAMLKSDKHLLSQISTGEGKSLIIVIVSIIKALNGEKVNVITSSHVLAERDAKEYKAVYKLFGISVGDNCSENLKDRIKVYSENIVVYGELANFQRDYLLHDLNVRNILGDRSYQTIIVDEVDSMLLDKGNNTLYLSHEIPGLDKLESVFVYIWISLNTHAVHKDTEFYVSDLKNKILNEMYGLVTKKDLNSLDMRLNAEEIDSTFDHLVREGVIGNNGTIHTTDIQWENLPETHLKKTHLRYFFKKIAEREKLIVIPNYLKKFVENHSEKWIKSGLRAMSMEPGIDYVVDVDRSNKSYDRSPNITIIDRDTGTDLTNSQWEDGLHQCLQIKHGCKLSLLSLKAVFISNVSYFKKYKTLLGLTGTLGSEQERIMLKEIYETNFVMIPTSKTKLFQEEEPIMCSSTDEWINTIYEKVNNKIKEKRSVLIVCETMNDVMILNQKFNEIINSQDSYVGKIHTYTRDFQSQIVVKELDPGLVIMSTNLAGRGTDLKLKSDLINAGGLHVCLTFLPKNCRIEEQAFGRAARKGEPGSGQLVFKNVSQKPSSTTVIDLKKERDTTESNRIIDISDYYQNHIRPEEEGFKQFLDVYKEVDSLHNYHEELKPILLQICLDEWAFWLEKNTNSREFDSQTNTFLKDLKCNLISGRDYVDYIENPFQLTKLGLVFIDLKKYEQAISLFDEVIKKEPSFSESARYYRLCSLPKVLETLDKEDILIELNLVAVQIKKRIKTLVISASTIDHIKKKNLTDILQIESFKEQQMNNCNTYELFLDNIYNMIGQEFTYADLICPSIIDEESASKMYNDLLEQNVISGPTVKPNLTIGDLDFVVQYGLLPEDLFCILKDSNEGKLDEKKLMKQLKDSRGVPSRELFWKELLSKNLLRFEDKYGLVDLHRLKLEDPSLRIVIESLKVSNKLEDENEIWLYHPEEINCSEENLVLIERDKLKEKIGENKYKLLKSKYIIHLNKLATLKPCHNIQLDYFDCLTKKDFQKVNISDDIAAEIINELKEKLIIQEKSDCKYSLSINAKDIETFKLSTFIAYSDDVVKLLNNRFAFRVALEQTWHFMQTKRVNTFSFPLQVRLEKCIVEDLYEHEVIRKSLVNPNQENCIVKTMTKLYPKAMTKEDYNNILRYIVDDNNVRKHIIESLIAQQWLIESGNDFPIRLEELSINLDITKKYEFQETNSELSPLYQCYSESIKLVLKRHSKFLNPEVQSFVKQFIYQHASSIHDFEVFDFSLCSLSEVLQQYNISFRDCTIFSINGFDRLLALKEKKYTRKMMISTLGTISFGIAQIAVGVIVKSGKVLEEGVKDLIFSIHCIISGRFSWKEYCTSKITSLVQKTWVLLNTIQTFTSSFGEKVATLSWSSIKNVFTGDVIREILKYSSVACATGVGYGVIDNILQPQLEKLGKTLVEYSLTNLDEIVDNHSAIATVKDMYLRFGKQKTQKIIEFNCNLISERCKTENDRDWAMVFNKIQSFVNKDTITYFEEFKKKKSISSKDFIGLLRNVSQLIKSVQEIIRVCGTYAVELSTKPSEMTDTLKLSLQKCLNSESDSPLSRREEASEEADQFIHEFLNLWEREIRSVYVVNVERCIIHPLLCFLKSKSVKYLSRITSRYACMLTEQHEIIESVKLVEPILNIDEFPVSVNQANRSEVVKPEVVKSFLCSEFDSCLAELSKMSPHSNISREETEHPAANINLKLNKKFTSFEKNRDSVLEGFKNALKKINHHLSSLEPHFKYFKLTFDDFNETNHVVIPTSKVSESYFNLYATNYELVIPLKDKKSNLLVDFKVTMDLIISYDNTQFRYNHVGPHSPHIAYKINPVNLSQGWNVETNCRGHVLIDYERKDMFYSVEDCLRAGELMVLK